MRTRQNVMHVNATLTVTGPFLCNVTVHVGSREYVIIFQEISRTYYGYAILQKVCNISIRISDKGEKTIQI